MSSLKKILTGRKKTRDEWNEELMKEPQKCCSSMLPSISSFCPLGRRILEQRTNHFAFSSQQQTRKYSSAELSSIGVS